MEEERSVKEDQSIWECSQLRNKMIKNLINHTKKINRKINLTGSSKPKFNINLLNVHGLTQAKMLEIESFIIKNEKLIFVS